MKVFVVSISDAEANTIISIHETYEGALKVWDNERLRLIKEVKRLKSFWVVRGHSHDYDNMLNKDIENLQCEDPEKIYNFPQDTPHITEYEVLP